MAVTIEAMIKSGTEHGHQAALFAYCAVARLRGWEIADSWARFGDMRQTYGMVEVGVGELLWFHAIPNGGARSAVTGGQMKAEGVKRGIADTFLPVARGGYHGLYIEMKKPSVRGKMEWVDAMEKLPGVSEEQHAFKEFVQQQGYAWVVCYFWKDAVDVLKWYLGLEVRT